MNLKSGTIWGGLGTALLMAVQVFQDPKIVEAAKEGVEAVTQHRWVELITIAVGLFTLVRARIAMGKAGADD